MRTAVDHSYVRVEYYRDITGERLILYSAILLGALHIIIILCIQGGDSPSFFSL